MSLELEKYDLELDKVVERIKKEKAKTVCIQLPDGLKPEATKIAKYLEEKTNCKVFIWLESNWGSCDYPLSLDKKVDLLINFGHTSPIDLMPNP
ncbi:MAG TPA: diphthamide synthesis protein [Candidatus Nanoarchaeia archaeon]|nr:diphthamide synthesis protein [Candidatus Nanoarchaeia archaeon]